MKKVAVLCGLIQEKEILANNFHFEVFCGVEGEELLDQDLAANYSAIMSWGTAGGLDPNLKVGQIVLASSVLTDSAEMTIDNIWANHLVPPIVQLVQNNKLSCAVGKIYSANEIAETKEQKATLFEKTGAICIDQESYIAAEYAQTNKLPFIAIRVISDDASMTLPENFGAALLKNDGSDSLENVFKTVAKNPIEMFALMQFGLHLKEATSALQTLHNRTDYILGRQF